MKLRRIEIQAFGVLEDFRLDFTDGGQAFFALNESGKSTCLAFIRCALYGMPRNQQSLLKSLRRRYQPFSKEYSAGSLLFEHEGREYRLTRHFAQTPAGDRTEFRDELLGDVLPLKDPSMPGVELLGMELGAFLNTAFVAQMELPYSSDADKDGALIKHLTDLGSTGDAEASITGLRDRLTEAKRRLNSRQRANSLIPQLEHDIEVLAQEEAEARIKRDRIADIRSQITLQEQALNETEAELRGLRKYQDLGRLKQQAQQLGERVSQSMTARSQLADLRRQRSDMEAGEAFEQGEGPRRVAALMNELRSRQDGQLARWHALRSVSKEPEPETIEAFEKTQALVREVQAQQARATEGTQRSEQLQHELQELQSQHEAKLEEQRVRQSGVQESLENFHKNLRLAEAQERAAHEEVVRLEQLNREEGFSAGQKHVQALKTYAEPYMRSLSLGSNIQALSRQEIRILKELEGQESETAQAKLSNLAEFSTARIAFTESLVHLPDDYQHESAGLDDWRKILNPAFSTDEAQASTDPQTEGFSDDVSDNDFDPETMTLSAEGQRIRSEHENLLKEAQEITRLRQEAEQDLDRKRTDFYALRSEVDTERKLISDVRMPSRTGMAFWPLLAVGAVIVGILAIVWMIRSDYLFLVLAALSFAVAGFALYRFRELRHALKLAEEVQNRRHAAAQAEKSLDKAEQDLTKAEDNLQAIREREQSLHITVQRSSMNWEGRRQAEAKQQRRLLEIRNEISRLKQEISQLDAVLPGLSDDYGVHLEAFTLEEKARETRLEQARENHLKMKHEVERVNRQLQEAEVEYQGFAEREEEQAFRAELQSLVDALQGKREAIRQQNEIIRTEREALLQSLKEAGFEDKSELETRFEELRDQKINHATRLKNSQEEATKLTEYLSLLEDDWSKLLELGQAVYVSQSTDDLWETAETVFPDPTDVLSKDRAMALLEELQHELQTLDDLRREKDRRYDRLLSDLKSVEEAMASWEEEAKQKAELEELETRILKLEAELQGISISDEREVETDILAKEQLVRELTAEVSGLRSSIQNQDERTPEEVLRDKFAVEEELNYRKLQLTAIQLAQEASQEAYKELRERFSPQLQALASEYLERITEGRYRRLIVKSDEKDMILEVFDESEGRAIEGEYLSGAAYEQIYLALRLGMIRILDPENKLPLLFDDILVQFDQVRERACLELFNDLVEEGRQIVYFTCSEATANRIKAISPSWEVKSLL